MDASLQTHAKILGVTLPTELRLLKAAFRKHAMIHHPDRGGDPVAFRELETAYRVLSKHTEILGPGNGHTLCETVNGVPLFKLGKGYPLNVSAKTCDNCEGRGYQILREPRRVKCDACHGDGWKHVKCNRCDNGKVKKNGVVVGDCYGCGGTGEFVPHDYAVKKGMRPKRFSIGNSRASIIFQSMFESWPENHYCDVCRGAGNYMKKDGEEYAVVCDECKGVGEIKMFNPVLPRGLLTGGN